MQDPFTAFQIIQAQHKQIQRAIKSILAKDPKAPSLEYVRGLLDCCATAIQIYTKARPSLNQLTSDLRRRVDENLMSEDGMIQTLSAEQKQQEHLLDISAELSTISDGLS